MEENKNNIDVTTTYAVTDESVKVDEDDAKKACEITSKKKKKTLIAILVAITVLIAAAAVICIILLGKGGSEEKRYAQKAIEALSQEMKDNLNADVVFLRVFVNMDKEPTDYTSGVTEEHNYYNTVARVYIYFSGEQTINGKTSISPMECCVFIDSDEKTHILYKFTQEVISSRYRDQFQDTEYPELALIVLYKQFEAMYNVYFPNDENMQDWTEIEVKAGQINLNIKQILGDVIEPEETNRNSENEMNE